ncbi:MAG: sulfotransferase domain-containing protein [Gemmatimonadota bacterium]
MRTGLGAVAAIPPRILSNALYGAAGLLKLAGAGLNWLRIRHVDFDPRPDDVFLVSYPHSGMAWLQLIVYRVTRGDDFDFAHIGERIPWFERMAFRDADPRDLASPRIFKSYLSRSRLPRGGGRCIYLCRDPGDVALEAFEVHRSHRAARGTPFSEFFERFEKGRIRYGRWEEHVAGWWSHRDDPDVLVLWHEDLCGDLEGAVRKISGFLGVDLDDTEVSAVVERCRSEELDRHWKEFDETVELLVEIGITNRGNFIRTGQSGHGAHLLSPDQRRRLESRILGRTGLDVAALMQSSSRVGGAR